MEQLTLDKISSWPTPPTKGNCVTIPTLDSKPIWTENKAKLIKEYLRLFQFITKHGVYIDGFAAPQNPKDEESWAAKLVLEMEPKWFNKFFLCDLNIQTFKILKDMIAAQEEVPRREIFTHLGDFNKYVQEILTPENITEKKATFALLDQRTFECHWNTVVSIAEHKKEGNKIELFYFFPTGWVSRAISGQKNIEVLNLWWGDDSWDQLIGKNQQSQVDTMSQRIQALGYKDVKAWPITKKHKGKGRVMYHMIHATDHLEAPVLMYRAYSRLVATPQEFVQYKLEGIDE